MRDEHDARGERVEEALEPVEPGEVEVVRRLVEQEDVEAGEQDRGERSLRGLAARERRHRLVGPRAEPDLGECGARARLEVLAAECEEPVERVRVRARPAPGSAPSRAASASIAASASADAGAPREVAEHRLARAASRLLRQVADRAADGQPGPRRAVSSPASTRSSVDLPIPFGPTMPIRSPGETTSETRSRTWRAAKLFEMSRAASEPGTGGPPSSRKGEKTAVCDLEVRHRKARRPRAHDTDSL